MPRTAVQTMSSKFIIWGVLLIALAIGFVALAVMISDWSITGQIALPVALLGAAMFYRDRIDRRKG